MSEEKPHLYEFGRFRLDAARRLLFKDGELVPLTPKVFETLRVLVERRGEQVTKDELMSEVWEGSIVEETNLTTNVSHLRKALGEKRHEHQYILTIPGEGYRFVAAVKAVPADGVELVMRERTRESLTIEEETTITERSRSLRLPFLLAGMLLVMVVVVAGFFFLRKPTPFSNIKLTRLTTTGKAGQAAISPDGKYVAHVMGDPGQQSIWLRHIDTGSDQEIAPIGTNYGSLFFTNDGSYIYYVRGSANTPVVLCRVPVLGGAASTIIKDIDSRATLSPNGKQLAFIRGYPDQRTVALIVANADGSGERQLATFGIVDFFPPGYTMHPAWSPDGEIIVTGVPAADAAGSYRQILTVRTKDGVATPLISPRWSSLGEFEWLNDGSGLVFTASDQAPRSPQQIWYLSYPAGETRKLTNDLNDYSGVSLTTDSRALVTLQTDRTASLWIAPSGDAQQAAQITANKYDGLDGLALAPDGRVVYTSRASGTLNLWITNPDGTTRTQLTTDAHSHLNPAICADGRYVLFGSDRAGSKNIWRMDIDGSNPKQLTSGKADLYPHCSPDSQWVAYLSDDNGKTTLWRVPIDGGNPTQLTDYSSTVGPVSPDGKQLVIGYRDEQGKWAAGVIPATGGRPIKKVDIAEARGRMILRWSPDGRELSYIVTRAGVSNIWSQPLDGGPPKQLTDFKSNLIFFYDWSRDGKQFALARGTVSSDVVLINDLR